MRLPRSLHCVRWFCFGLLVAGSALAAEPPPVPPGVFELPKLTVTNPQELPPPEAWRYTKIPGVEVLSNASDSSTQRFLKDFQMLQQVIDTTWPGMRAAASTLPTTVILYGRSEGAENFLRPKGTLVGEEIVEFEPFDPEGTDNPTQTRRVASRFLNDEETACIVVDLQEGGAGLADPYRQFYGEYVRYLVSRLEAPVPPWLEEGVCKLYSGVDFTDKWISFARVGTEFGGRRAGDFNAILQRPPVVVGSSSKGVVAGMGAFPSLAELLRADRHQLMASYKLRALAHAFVHMCLYGRGQRHQKSLFFYLDRIRGGVGSEELFAESFGMTIKKMQEEIVGYVSFTDHKQIVFKAKKGGGLLLPPPAVLREATQAEVGRIKGQGLMLAGSTDAARLELVAPYVRGEQDADHLAVLGLYELRAGRRERGRKFLETAAAGHATNAVAWLELARLRYAESRTPLEEKQCTAVLDPLRTAGGLQQPLLGVYELMAKIWLESPVKPPAGDLAMLEQGVQRFSRQLGFVYQTAQLHAASGLTKQAARMAEWGQRVAQTTADKERFGRLLAGLPSGATLDAM
jgi:hypothetical protein